MSFQPPPLVPGFLVFRQKSLELDSLAIKDSATLKDRVSTPVTCFRSVNGQLEWDELQEAWRAVSAPTTDDPDPVGSDIKFLEMLAEITVKELNSEELNVEMLKKLETVLEVSHFSTKDISGRFNNVRVAIRLQIGKIILLGKKQTFSVDLDQLLETDSTPECLARIEEPHTQAKIQFIQQQPVMWLQFGGKRRLLLPERQKFVLLVFQSVAERDLFQKINKLVLHTSYTTARKKILAKLEKMGRPKVA